MVVPKGKELRLLDSNSNSILAGNGNSPKLYIEEDVTLTVSSSFRDFISGLSGPTAQLLSGLSSSFQFTDTVSFSGQFAFQSFQVWERTEPIEMKFVCRLEMESSGLRDVVEPTKKLLLYTLPSEDSIGGLVAPGPSVVNAIRNIAQNLEGDAGYVEKINNFVNPLLENILSDGDGNLTLVVGDYLSLSPVIITQVIPTFSNSVDDEGYPIWVNLDISIRTANVPTKSIGVGNGITMSAGGN